MDPYLEQRLRDEVLYLHSLWRQGPPYSSSSSSSSNPNPRINPNPSFNSRPVRNRINPSQPDPDSNSDPNRTNRKRTSNRRDEGGERPSKKKSSLPDPPSHSDRPWPCPSPAHESSPGKSTPWPSMPTKPNSAASPSPEEKFKFAALLLQHRASEACRALFSGNAGSDSEESECAEEDGDDCWVENGGECEEYNVLLNLFEEKSELRRYYEVNSENGEFSCLVCCGLGKKNKTVKGCAGLLQHSISISNTKRKRAHRAFAKVVCRVLGWDFNRLPTIVLKGERLGLSLEKTGNDRGEPEVNAGSAEAVSGCFDDNVAAENYANAELDEKEVLDDHQNDSKEVMICQNSLMKDDGTKKSTEITDQGISETEANKEVVDACVELAENWDGYKNNAVVSKENLDSMCGHNGELVSIEGSDVQSNESSKTSELQGELAGNASDDKDSVVSNDNLDSMSSPSGEIVSEESNVVQSKGTLKICQLQVICNSIVQSSTKSCQAQDELQENTDDHRNNVVISEENLDSMSGHNGEIVGKEESDVLKSHETSKTCEFQAELEDNTDDHKDNGIASTENLDSRSGLSGEIVSKEEFDVAQSKETSKTCEFLGENEKNVAGEYEDLHVFMENLDPL